MKILIPQQAPEYEDYKNDTQHEEYETYEERFDFAARDRAETWNREVNLVAHCLITHCTL